MGRRVKVKGKRYLRNVINKKECEEKKNQCKKKNPLFKAVTREEWMTYTVASCETNNECGGSSRTTFCALRRTTFTSSKDNIFFFLSQIHFSKTNFENVRGCLIWLFSVFIFTGNRKWWWKCVWLDFCFHFQWKYFSKRTKNWKQ